MGCSVFRLCVFCQKGNCSYISATSHDQTVTFFFSWVHIFSFLRAEERILINQSDAFTQFGLKAETSLFFEDKTQRRLPTRKRSHFAYIYIQCFCAVHSLAGAEKVISAGISVKTPGAGNHNGWGVLPQAISSAASMSKA